MHDKSVETKLKEALSSLANFRKMRSYGDWLHMLDDVRQVAGNSEIGKRKKKTFFFASCFTVTGCICKDDSSLSISN